MKSNLSHVFTAVMLLALVLTFVAVPVSAETEVVTNVTVTVDPPVAGADNVEYEIDFYLAQDMQTDEPDYFYVDFPEETTLPATYTANSIEVTAVTPDGLQTIPVPAGKATIGIGKRVTIETPGDFASGAFTITFLKGFGITNPPTGDTYCLKVETSNEVEGEGCYLLEDAPVVLYLKRQVPKEQCGYKELDIVATYDTVKEALDAARDIWLQESDRSQVLQGFGKWNLFQFQDCPDLSDLSDSIQGEAKGVYVGAVIAVGPGTYTETLRIDVPGLMMGATSPKDTDITAFDFEGASPKDGGALKAGLLIDDVGGVSIGDGVIHEGTDAFGDPDPLKTFNIYGFSGIRNAGTDGYGVGVVVSDTCDYPIYDGTAVLGGMVAGVFTPTISSTFSATSTFLGSVSPGQKLTNLSTGFSAYISETTGTTFQAAYTWPLADADPVSPTIEFINTDDYYAVFTPTLNLTCEDARVDIRGNTIEDNAAGGIGVYNASVWVDGNIVQNNDDDGFWGERLRCDGVMICDGEDRLTEILQISNNEFLNNGTGSAADWLGEDECFDERVNPHDYNQAGIDIVSTVGADSGYLHINNNLMRGNGHAGLVLSHNAADAQHLRIYWNDVEQNPFGLMTTAFTPEEVDFRYNNIVGNGLWGVKNFGCEMQEGDPWFTAKENYWGSWAGPSDGPRPCAHQEGEQSEALGNGDAVSSYVYYNPWLTVDAHNLKLGRPYQHVRAYGSDTLELQMGWNTLSLPLPPDARANHLEEIFGLGPGTFLQDEDGNAKFEKAYEYNGAWDSLTSGDDDDDLKVLHGYYIKMVKPTRFPIIYGTTWIELPEYELVKGWNLIGSGFGIDRDADPGQGRWGVARPESDDEAEKYESEALVSIARDTVGGGAAMVVSPYVAGQIASWVSTWPVGGAPVADNLMYTGEGYWVFMKQSGTLAGFELAPLTFQGDPPLPMR